MENGYKKLKRSRMSRMLCGVCGGLGEYVGIDPTVVRIIWLIASICSVGTGLIIYLIAAIIIPDEDMN
jgi:phage shock protein PspC (stress-responsive transcriptional regulator)